MTTLDQSLIIFFTIISSIRLVLMFHTVLIVDVVVFAVSPVRHPSHHHA